MTFTLVCFGGRQQTGRAEAEALVDCSVLTYLLASGLDMHLGGQFKALKDRVLAFATGLKGNIATYLVYMASRSK